MPTAKEAISKHAAPSSVAATLTLGAVVVALATLDSIGAAPWFPRAHGEEMSKQVEVLKQRADITDEKLDLITDKQDVAEDRLDTIQTEQARQGARQDRIIELQNRVLDKLDESSR